MQNDVLTDSALLRFWTITFASRNHECGFRIAEWIELMHATLGSISIFISFVSVSPACVPSLLWLALVIFIHLCFLHICLRLFKVVYCLHWFCKQPVATLSITACLTAGQLLWHVKPSFSVVTGSNRNWMYCSENVKNVFFTRFFWGREKGYGWSNSWDFFFVVLACWHYEPFAHCTSTVWLAIIA